MTQACRTAFTKKQPRRQEIYGALRGRRGAANVPSTLDAVIKALRKRIRVERRLSQQDRVQGRRSSDKDDRESL